MQRIWRRSFQGCKRRPRWGLQNRTSCFVTALGQQPTFTQSSTCVSARQTGPPARINQFKLPVWNNKPQELSWRGLASACSACPDLNADLRASLASQLQRTAEKGSRLHQAPTKNVSDRTALCGQRCQLEAVIPIPVVKALPGVTTLLPLTSPVAHQSNITRELYHRMGRRPMLRRGSKRTTH